MDQRLLFYVITGLFGMAILVNLIFAARICYQIEERSGRPMLKGGLPGYANIIPVAFNFGVAKDDETQDLRWQMNKRLLIVLGGFFCYTVYLRLAAPDLQ
jgi:hypothetical protein